MQWSPHRPREAASPVQVAPTNRKKKLERVVEAEHSRMQVAPKKTPGKAAEAAQSPVPAAPIKSLEKAAEAAVNLVQVAPTSNSSEAIFIPDHIHRQTSIYLERENRKIKEE